MQNVSSAFLIVQSNGSNEERVLILQSCCEEVEMMDMLFIVDCKPFDQHSVQDNGSSYQKNDSLWLIESCKVKLEVKLPPSEEFGDTRSRQAAANQLVD